MIKQIFRSQVVNKELFDTLYQVAHIREATEPTRYKLMGSPQVLSVWMDQLDYAPTDIRAIMTANQLANAYVERYPYTMMIKDEPINQPEPGS